MKNLGWWILGAGVVGAGIFVFTRKAAAQSHVVTSTGRIGGFTVPVGLRRCRSRQRRAVCSTTSRSCSTPGS